MDSRGQAIRKTIVYFLYIGILIALYLYSDSDDPSFVVDISCQPPVGPFQYCAHCLRVPPYVHPDFQYLFNRENAFEITRLPMSSCLNFTCSEVIQMFEFHNRKVQIVDLPEIKAFMGEMGVKEGNHGPLAQFKQLVVITENLKKPLEVSQRVSYPKAHVNQQTVRQVIGICGASIIILLYIAIFCRKCQLSWVTFFPALLTQTFLILHYTYQIHYCLLLSHLAFVFYCFTELKCLRPLLPYALIVTGLIQVTIQTLSAFLSLGVNIAIVVALICSDAGSVGKSEIVGCLGFMLYSGVMLAAKLTTTRIPFMVMGVAIIEWTIVLLEVYGLDRVEFQMYDGQKGADPNEVAHVQDEGEFLNQEEGDNTTQQETDESFR